MTFPLYLDIMKTKVEICFKCKEAKVCHPVPEGYICEDCLHSPTYFEDLKEE